MLVNLRKFYYLLFIFIHFVLSSAVYPQDFIIIGNDSVYYSHSKINFVDKIISSDSNTLWMYYDYTGCADFFLDRNNRDSSFTYFLNFINVPVIASFRSTDGIGNQRCNLCKCPYGTRFNFKIRKSDYDKIIKQFTGSLNLSLFGVYK